VLVSAMVAVELALWLLRGFRAMNMFLCQKQGYEGEHWVAYFFSCPEKRDGTSF
jgi:hypothetical protein